MSKTAQLKKITEARKALQIAGKFIENERRILDRGSWTETMIEQKIASSLNEALGLVAIVESAREGVRA